MGKRALLGCMLVATAAGTFWATSRRELERVPSPEPTAVPPAPAPAVAVAPSAPVGPSGMDGSFVVPQVAFESGFCAPEGDETIEVHSEATVPEIRFAVAEPDLDIANVETAVEALFGELLLLVE